MPFKFVIFDFDGTLANSLGWLARVMPEAAAIFRFRKIGSENHAYLRSLDADELIDYLGISAWKLPFLACYLRIRLKNEIQDVTLYHGVEEMLNHISSIPVRFAVLSSNSKSNVQRVFGNHISTFFDHYQCKASFLGKTNQLKKLLDKSGFNPHETLLIGDEIRDLEAARMLGVSFGAVTWGFNDHTAFERYQPDFLFHDVSDITKLLISQKPPISHNLPLSRN